jgi:hypothetical protein
MTLMLPNVSGAGESSMTFLAALSEIKLPDEVMQSDAIMTPPLYLIEMRVVPMLTGW